jgi:hypothetical protein
MFDESPPIDTLSGHILPGFSKDPCDGGLMGLFIQLGQIQWADVIVPPMHVRSIEEHVEKVHIQSLRDEITNRSIEI